MLRNIRIGYRLSIGFGLLVLVLILLAGFALNRMNLLAKQTTLMHDHPLAVSNAVLRINTNIIRIHRNMKDVALAQSEAGIEIASRKVDKCEENVYKDFVIIDKQFLGENEKYEKALKVFSEWKVIRDRVLSLKRDGENLVAANITKGIGAIHVLRIEKAMESLSDFAQGKAKELYDTVKDVEQEALKMMYLLFGVSLALVIVFAIVFTRSITAPVLRLTKLTELATGGDLTHKIDILTKDEIGKLANSFNTMIHSLKQAQEELVTKEKFATIGRISGSIAHDIRHPLATIKNSAYFLDMTLKEPNEKTKKHLKLISNEVLFANEIITSLMRLSETKKAEMNKTNINELVNNFFSSYSLPEHIKLVTEFDNECPDIMVDRSHLMLILTNLASNAISAMPESGTITVKTQSVWNLERAGDFVEIAFADTGSGIHRDNLDKVFEPFYTTKSKGIGLGLSIVNEVITANDGYISVESEDEKGSTFKLLFPPILQLNDTDEKTEKGNEAV